ncbi:asparagine synthase (glutamine-hydrolyzing) [Streptomyces sp.]|uniref:asparagine synthase (glutamine-hydrolyzing) n=1 Tax=Streptomyces sp. TaxID=1931 RepID=UPI002D78ADA8|nr:asparagine synthase (glutamine-hydrolyzing) [Streptomyces sp.]HET6356858.1 asparagine synthase (glutamine-hydrolyzing) [Streptomyces sp.]
MCGLAGTARWGGGALPATADGLLRRMTKTIAHRGPDDTDFFRAGPVGLGFVRLSLVDPEGGRQPLSTEDGSLVLIANGEIYNHRELAAGLPSGTRLRTKSDCEVLLHLYRRDGLSFLDRVRGMFSVVLWDRERNLLVFARDRFGIKPLFFHENEDRIVFSSEIKALFNDPDCPRELDWERALTDQLMTGNLVLDDSPPHAWFKEIELAPAASILTFDLTTGERRTHQYWSFPEFDGDRTGSESDLIRSYAETLASSVQDCETADVEIGLFLSGGIDSAAVAALAGINPRTFTALNGSTLENRDAEWAHRTAAQLGLVNHQVLQDTSAVPGVEEWKRHLWQMETPLAGPETYYKYELYRHVGTHAPEIKAMLLGGGSDEFNGGYTSSFAGGGDWSDFEANINRMGIRGDQQRLPELGAWWDQPGPPLVRAEALRAAVGSSRREAYEMVFRAKYRDVQIYNCWHEDRTAAGNGIEARVPFLDHRLLEIVAAIPYALRPGLIWDKQILRRGLAGVLPEDVVNRPKIPFFYGTGVRHTYRTFARMLAQQGDRLLDQALSGPGARQHLDADNMRTMLRQMEANPGSGYVEFLLRAVNLGLLESMAADLPGPLVDAPKATVPGAVPITDWDTQAPEIEALVVRRPAVDPQAVLARADGLLLLRSPEHASTWYLALDGSIEYVVDEDEEPDWIPLLQAFDGVRTLAETVSGLGLRLKSFEALLAEAVEAGLLAPAAETR